MKRFVVLSSVIANKPYNGGNARMVLNWLEGLERLDIDVFFIEQISSDCCVDAADAPATASQSINRTYFGRVMSAAGFAGRSALICDGGRDLRGAVVYGATPAELLDIADAADLLINVSGHLSIAALKDRFRRRVYVDLDPGYTQIWHADGSGAARLEGHDVYFTVGQRIGTPLCTVPTDGIAWRPIRQPIVLKACDTSAANADRFTTIASWRGAYTPVPYRDTTFQVKAHEFRKIVPLPSLCGQRFEIALDIHRCDTKDLTALEGAGWRVVNPRRVVETPEDYCRYIEGSAAECSAAQGIYVQTRSGWFSDRSARYLAAGKPVLVQDTGFREPDRRSGGLVAFTTLAEAAQGAEQIARDYREHSAAARWLAERYFDSDTQLAQLLDQAGVG